MDLSNPCDGSNDAIPYTLIRSARKTLGLSVTKEGKVVARAPKQMSQTRIDAFVQQNQDWIRQHLAQVNARLEAQRALDFSDGQTIPVLGHPYTIKTATVALPCIREQLLLLPTGSTDRRQTVEEFYRTLAAKLLPERVAHFSAVMGVYPTGIKITGARTRWGSCSGRNSLCFSWRLLCLSPDLVDSVVVHELAHIRHKDHSPRFYREVEAVLPGYAQLRQRLRTEARNLLL